MATEKSNTNIQSGLEDLKIIEPFNETDPKVILDPKIEEFIVVKQDINLENSDVDPKKFDGITVPIVQFNNHVLGADQLLKVKISSIAFEPTIELKIHDSDNIIGYTDIPKTNNKIYYVLTNNFDGTYKKIKMEFYVTSFYYESDKVINIYGVYKNVDLNKNLTKMYGKLSTFDLFKLLATQSGLGFAATQDPKMLSDVKNRSLVNMNLMNYMSYEISRSGFDKYSIFDGWIDFYNYINVVNLPWILNTTNAFNQYMCYANIGQDFNGVGVSNRADFEPTLRMITNSTELGKVTNLQIESFEYISDPSDALYNGVLLDYYYTRPYGIDDGSNSIKRLQLIKRDKGDFNDEQIENYEFSKKIYLGFDFSEDGDILQQEINKQYLNKIRSKKLKILLTQPNFALQRGVIVNVLLVAYDLPTKIALLNRSTDYMGLEGIEERAIAALKGEPVQTNEKDDSIITEEYETNIDLIAQQMPSVLDEENTGMFYIDGVEFDFDRNNGNKINQYLYCIKLGDVQFYNKK